MTRTERVVGPTLGRLFCDASTPNATQQRTPSARTPPSPRIARPVPATTLPNPMPVFRRMERHHPRHIERPALSTTIWATPPTLEIVMPRSFPESPMTKTETRPATVRIMSTRTLITLLSRPTPSRRKSASTPTGRWRSPRTGYNCLCWRSSTVFTSLPSGSSRTPPDFANS